MNNKKTIISTVLIVAVLLIARMLGVGAGDSSEDNGIVSQNNAVVSQTTESKTENAVESVEDDTTDSVVETEEAVEETEDSQAENKTEITSADSVDNVTENSSDNKSESVEIIYKFRNKSLWKEHFEKHGAEFPYDTKEEYLEGANIMMANPNKLHKQEKDDGDDVYYLEETNEFIIISGDGYLRTYFKPSRGKAYFDSQ